MGAPDPRLDAYIAKSADFAQPVLRHLRQVVQAGCPDVEETIKWGMPHFYYRGKNMAHMAAFKAHCGFGFWHGDQVTGAEADRSAMGQFGRIATVKDLPPKAELLKLVRKAAALIDAGDQVPRAPKPAPKPSLPAPADLLAALRRSAAARRTFEGLPPSGQRDYIEWLLEAKQAATREKRLAQAIEWMEEGKSRHWKYRK